MNGSLTIIGLGPANPEHLSLEAMTAIQRASTQDHFYGLAHAREIIQHVRPNLKVKSLDYLYGIAGVDRSKAYLDLAQMMIDKAFVDGLSVFYCVAGSPLFYNDAVWLVRKICSQKSYPLRLIHGMSFVELVLQNVFWTGHRGLQLYSTWNIARDNIALNPEVPALLCQLGEFSAGGEALQTAKSTAILQQLRTTLQQVYPQAHPVTILYSSGPPNYNSLSTEIPLSELGNQPVPVYSNLWVPPVGGDNAR